jgi:hypothetical protein
LLLGATAMSDLNFTHLKELLQYNPETGVFTWINKMGRRVKAGAKAGCLTKRGYVQIRINFKSYAAHRLAWLYIHESFPSMSIDHIDGDKTNNAIKNLRLATIAENCQNLKKSRGKTGFLGVTKDSVRGNRWKASIKLNGKQKHLGWFKTPEEAHQAYIDAKRLMHPFGTL